MNTAPKTHWESLNTTGENAFAQQGFPTTKTEKWKFTPLQKLAKTNFTPVGKMLTPDTIATAKTLLKQSCPVDYAKIVVINGVVCDELSQPLTHAVLSPLCPTMAGSIAPLDQMPMVALNTAHASGGLHITVNDNATDTVHVIYITLGDTVVNHARTFVTVGENATLTMVESHLSSGTDILTTHVTEATLAQNATWHHNKIQNEGNDTTHYSHVDSTVAQGGNYDNFVLHLGAKTARCESRTNLNGVKSNVNLNGAYITNGTQHHDSATFIGHMAPDCTSHELYKGVLTDKGKGVFQGKILVDQIAQRTDGYQMNRALLLSDRATVNTKPELEIYADDVLCSHGCTTGELDEEQLFYLISRGINKKTAQALLIDAFVRECVDHVVDEHTQTAINTLISDKLTTIANQD